MNRRWKRAYCRALKYEYATLSDYLNRSQVLIGPGGAGVKSTADPNIVKKLEKRISWLQQRLEPTLTIKRAKKISKLWNAVIDEIEEEWSIGSRTGIHRTVPNHYNNAILKELERMGCGYIEGTYAGDHNFIPYGDLKAGKLIANICKERSFPIYG